MKRYINHKYKKFVDLLKFSNGRYNCIDIFKDFVIIFAITIKNKFNYSQEDEDIYLQIIKKYNKSELEVFIKLSAELMFIYLEETQIGDVLGDIYQQIGANSKVANQFFTPIHIAKFMSAAILSKEEIRNKEFISISDPTCGSGVLLLSIAEFLRENEIDYKDKILVEAQDVDFICVCMTYIQLSLNGIPGRVILGDTLQDEKRKIFYTPQYYIGNWYEKIKEREEIKDGRE